jgi:hypothetical protein
VFMVHAFPFLGCVVSAVGKDSILSAVNDGKETLRVPYRYHYRYNTGTIACTIAGTIACTIAGTIAGAAVACGERSHFSAFSAFS